MLSKFVKSLTVWRVLFIAILIAGLYSTFVRVFQGLGAATNLSDKFPWGLWIGFDVLVGVGLAAGGFVIAATVHIFGLEKYESIARPTILTAFLGYLLVVVAILFDIGRPYRLWHPLIMWNPRSVMFEVSWCVTLYTIVLALEFSPLVLEKLGLKAPLKWVRKVFVPIVIAGVLLSTLHQSSLGTLYVITPDKMHGLWYTPLMPVLFFISAIAVGLAMTIFESFLSLRAFGKSLEKDLLAGLGRIIVVVLAVYAVARGQDLISRGNLPLVFQITPESVLFWGEIGLGVLLPMALFATPKVREKESGLFLASVLTIMGFIVNRLNVAITGMARSSGTDYFPSWMEISVTVMIVAIGFFLFGQGVKYLEIFPDESPHANGARPKELMRRPAFHGGVVATFWALLLVGVGLVTFAIRQTSQPPIPTAEAAIDWVADDASLKDLRLPNDFVFPSSDDSPGPVTFRHSTHVAQTANTTTSCTRCHQNGFRLLAEGKPWVGELSDEAIHQGNLCGSCHNGQTAFSAEEDCESCHVE